MIKHTELRHRRQRCMRKPIYPIHLFYCIFIQVVSESIFQYSENDVESPTSANYDEDLPVYYWEWLNSTLQVTDGKELNNFCQLWASIYHLWITDSGGIVVHYLFFKHKTRENYQVWRIYIVGKSKQTNWTY